MATGNLVLKKGVGSVYTTVGASAPAYDSISAGYYPSDLLPISLASAGTLTLPPARLTSTALGAGDGQELGFMNLAAIAVTVVAASGDAIRGASATITQNSTQIFKADAQNGLWYRIQ